MTIDPSGWCHDHHRIPTRPRTGTPTDRRREPPPVLSSTGPSVTDYASAGTVEKWHDVFGRIHRDDGPAMVCRTVEGMVTEERWFLRGNVHRIGEPALIRYFTLGADERGPVKYVEWGVKGMVHRIDGPAVTHYAIGGQVIEEHWRADHKAHTGLVDVAETISSWSTVRLNRELSATRFAPLLAEGIHARVVVGALRGGVTTPEGVREVANGAPPEWVRAYEESQT